ncbi:hypothetical protein [Streptomyces sp. ICC4]|uniref:hypothetical protein n=1 Tax=Streptomyces sp. ICC4 TaxID=2099584 RepID=UPI001EF7D6BF|nr:hypothetical protein [Streptomyces sp. ICC4]
MSDAGQQQFRDGLEVVRREVRGERVRDRFGGLRHDRDPAGGRGLCGTGVLTADGTNRTTQNALAPGYERLIVTHSPTRSGQHQKDLPLDIRKDAQKHADWHRDDKLAKHLALTETNDEAALSRPKGFTDEDLANIDAYLRHGDPGAGLHDTTRQAVEALAVRAAAIDTSDDAQRDAIAREFASLLAGLPDHERLDALRARNIYAQSVAHLLQSPALSGPAADAPETSRCPGRRPGRAMCRRPERR